MPLRFDNQFADKFPELSHAQSIQPDGKGRLRWVNDTLWKALSGGDSVPGALVDWVSGNKDWPGTKPVAQKYAGHQFGHFNPYLGDGRGLLVGQVQAPDALYDLHVKGAGPTPYSRGGDGRAVLRSSIRELLASEAFYALGIPTTRALALVSTEGQIQRETVEPGAMLVRVARTHIRFGHFEHCLYRNLEDSAKRLWQHSIESIWPGAADKSVSEQFRHVVKATAEMIAKWQAYGFVHGVMNTDNMSLAGETFDYGPYAFFDDYKPGHIFNHTDHAGRYGFMQQPGVGLWNLKRLAHALGGFADDQSVNNVLEGYEPVLRETFLNVMKQRLGLTDVSNNDTCWSLISGWLMLLETYQLDYNLSYRALGAVLEGNWQSLSGNLGEIAQRIKENGQSWLNDYTEAVANKPDTNTMKQVNPLVILRTHHAQYVIEQAEQGSDEALNEYINALMTPFEEKHKNTRWVVPPESGQPPAELSCSS
ncbi:hypothetical protein CEW91_06995 [Idiomarina piscisalsi]|uniref:Protein nucleotidyltransferase YdiU n=1 Tax=Idiomarina piscisalsi TaxID=1096243 RepID=A0ABM6LTY6_9GAMM|nr:YdiU family protein [Idiomarina piscisalsi]ASG65899.1 hypothetical protein CEW91_06995 [Idiomarina piscisalsi]